MGNQDVKPEEELATMVAKSSIPIVVCNPRLPDDPIIICNEAFVTLTGYNKEEIIGRNCRFLRGKDTEPKQTKILSDAIRNHQHVLVEILNYKRDGSPFRNALMIAPMFDDDGRLAYFMGSQMEVIDEVGQDLSSRQLSALEAIGSLSPKQKQVLIQMARGLQNKQIAHILNISVSTVKMHRSRVLDKLDVSTSAEAIRVAVEAGY